MLTEWTDLLQLLGTISLAIGAFFTLTGGLGVWRFPDFYTRLHPAGIKDSFGAPLILAGLAMLSGGDLTTLKIILLLLFFVLTNPTSTHALAKSALADGHMPLGSIDSDVDVARRPDALQADTLPEQGVLRDD